MKIYIRPGHGGSDTGAVANGLVEKDINLAVALKAAEQFGGLGHEVRLARTADMYVSLEQGVSEANQWGADFFLSIHHNAGGGDGAEIFHTLYGGEGKKLAGLIMQEFVRAGQNARYITARESTVNPGHDYYYEIRYTNMPALILEYAYLDTGDRLQIDEPHEQEAEAAAIVRGFSSYIGKPYTEDTADPAPSLDEALKILTGQVLESPDYWRQAAGIVKNLDKLLINMAGEVRLINSKNK